MSFVLTHIIVVDFNICGRHIEADAAADATGESITGGDMI